MIHLTQKRQGRDGPAFASESRELFTTSLARSAESQRVHDAATPLLNKRVTREELGRHAVLGCLFKSISDLDQRRLAVSAAH